MIEVRLRQDQILENEKVLLLQIVYILRKRPSSVFGWKRGNIIFITEMNIFRVYVTRKSNIQSILAVLNRHVSGIRVVFWQ